MTDSSTIYKLVGPVLLKQDRTEAVATVNGRLEYIGGEMYVSLRFLTRQIVTVDKQKVVGAATAESTGEK